MTTLTRAQLGTLKVLYDRGYLEPGRAFFALDAFPERNNRATADRRNLRYLVGAGVLEDLPDGQMRGKAEALIAIVMAGME